MQRRRVPAPPSEASIAVAATAPTADDFLGCLSRADPQAAIDLVVEAHAAGCDLESLLCAVIAPALARVGQLWADGKWSIAQEHAATAIADAAIAELATRNEAKPQLGEVVMCCASDAHRLGARMTTELLRARGWQVTLIDTPVSFTQLTESLLAAAPLAMGVSSTVAMSLPGARRSIDAAHAAGIPVIAGGAAFGDDQRRALALGADGWADDAPRASSLLHEWDTGRRVKLRRPANVSRDWEALEATWFDLTTTTIQRLESTAAKRGGHDLSSRTREDVENIVRSLIGAIVVADDDVFIAALVRALKLFEMRGTARTELADALGLLTQLVPRELGEAHRLLEKGQHCVRTMRMEVFRR